MLHANAADGRVRFKPDSSYVAIRTKLWNVTMAPHIALTGSAGFDLYISDRYIKNFMPPLTINGGYESVVELGTSEMRKITINFPHYSEVTELHIGIRENASVYEPSHYRPEKPIVYDGSSITQGACASRPGNSYQNILARRLAMKKEKKRVAAELQLHSDQGFQYTSQAYFRLTQSYGITPSMSRKGNPYDNAMAENFFSTLKTECIYRHKPKTFREANDLIDRYIHFYNHERIQNKTGVAPLTLRHSA